MLAAKHQPNTEVHEEAIRKLARESEVARQQAANEAQARQAQLAMKTQRDWRRRLDELGEAVRRTDAQVSAARSRMNDLDDDQALEAAIQLTGFERLLQARKAALDLHSHQQPRV